MTAREGIEQRDWNLADVEIARIAGALGRETDLILRAAALMARMANVKAMP